MNLYAHRDRGGDVNLSCNYQDALFPEKKDVTRKNLMKEIGDWPSSFILATAAQNSVRVDLINHLENPDKIVFEGSVFLEGTFKLDGTEKTYNSYRIADLNSSIEITTNDNVTYRFQGSK